MDGAGWRVECGDCLDAMRGMDAGCVDAVVTDPPYGIDWQSRRTSAAKRKPKVTGDDSPFVWWLYDAARIMADGGCLICFCRWDVAEAFRLAIGWAGLRVRSQLVWDRVAHGMGDLKGQAAPQHDTIWFATKGKYGFPGNRPKSVLRHARASPSNLTHSCEKPVSLMLDIVEAYVGRGTVLDPFAGSGSTGVACALAGVNFIGIEKDHEHAATARARIEAAHESQAA